MKINIGAAYGDPDLKAVAHEMGHGVQVPVGAFSFATGTSGVLEAVNDQLRRYLGSAEHRARMAVYDTTHGEIDGAHRSGIRTTARGRT